MIRINATIAKPQYDALHKLSEKTGLTMSDLIRRAVEQYLSMGIVLRKIGGKKKKI